MSKIKRLRQGQSLDETDRLLLSQVLEKQPVPDFNENFDVTKRLTLSKLSRSLSELEHVEGQTEEQIKNSEEKLRQTVEADILDNKVMEKQKERELQKNRDESLLCKDCHDPLPPDNLEWRLQNVLKDCPEDSPVISSLKGYYREILVLMPSAYDRSSFQVS